MFRSGTAIAAIVTRQRSRGFSLPTHPAEPLLAAQQGGTRFPEPGRNLCCPMRRWCKARLRHCERRRQECQQHQHRDPQAPQHDGGEDRLDTGDRGASQGTGHGHRGRG